MAGAAPVIQDVQVAEEAVNRLAMTINGVFTTLYGLSEEREEFILFPLEYTANEWQTPSR